MKPEIPLKGGDEYDMFSSLRGLLFWHKHEKKKIKRQYWKRVRRLAKKLKGELNGDM